MLHKEILSINLKNYGKAKHEQHPFHLVDSSPWPAVLSLALLSLTLHLVY